MLVRRLEAKERRSMARIRKIEGKRGVSYQLIASFAYVPGGKRAVKTKTWRPPAKLTPEQADQRAMVEAENSRASDILEALLMPKEGQGRE